MQLILVGLFKYCFSKNRCQKQTADLSRCIYDDAQVLVPDSKRSFFIIARFCNKQPFLQKHSYLQRNKISLKLFHRSSNSRHIHGRRKRCAMGPWPPSTLWSLIFSLSFLVGKCFSASLRWQNEVSPLFPP